MKVLSRSFLGWLGVVTLAAMAVAGCQGSSSTSSSQPTRASTITIAAVQGNEDAPLKALAPLYTQKTGTQVQIVEFPYDQLFEKLVTTFQANASSYDLAMMDDPWMPKFGTGGWLTPLDSTFGFKRDSDIPGIVYDVGTWPPPHGPVPPAARGKAKHLLGITIVGNVEMFMYRKDLSDAPTSWSTVLANAQRLNKPGSLVGYVVRGKATNPIVADFLPILWSFGGDVFDQNWNPVINSPASLAAVKFLVQDLKSVGEPGADSTDAADRSRLMAIGQAYESTVWPGEVTDIVENRSVSQVIGKVAYEPIPAGPHGKGYGMMGNWLLGIPKASKNGSTAADFIKWLSSPAVQRQYVAKGGIPDRLSLLNDPALNQQNPYFAALAKSLQAGPNWRPRTDQWNAVETILGTNLNAALSGQITADDAVQKSATQIRTLMQQAGYYG
jgi:multiple sugar transport system substrate-binding protein